MSAKECFQLFIKNASKRFLEKMNFSVSYKYIFTMIDLILTLNVPTAVLSKQSLSWSCITSYMYILHETFNGNHYGVAWN